MAGFSFNTNPASSSSPSPFSFASSSSTSPISFSSNPSSSPSLFGASSAPSNPTFGTPSSSSASSTSSFGFNFASSSSSTPSSAAPSFGFGASSASTGSTFGFGTTSSSSTGSSFGGSSLFGSSSSSGGTTATTATTSLFGSTGSTSTTFGASSIFGASSAAASAPSSTTAAIASPVSSSFGSGLFGSSSGSSLTTFGASPSVATSASSTSSPATSFPSLFGSSSSSSASSSSISSSVTAQSSSSSGFSFLSSSSSSSLTSAAPASSASGFSFPSAAATSAPSFSFSSSAAVGNSTGAAASAPSLFGGSSSSASSGFSFASATTGASSSASTTTPAFSAFGVASSSTTGSTATGSLSSFASPATAAASTGTSSSFLGFQTSSKSVGTPTPASQPQSTAALSLFGTEMSLRDALKVPSFNVLDFDFDEQVEGEVPFLKQVSGSAYETRPLTEQSASEPPSTDAVSIVHKSEIVVAGSSGSQAKRGSSLPPSWFRPKLTSFFRYADVFADDMEIDPNTANDKFVPEWDIWNKDSVMNDLTARMFLFNSSTPLDYARSRKMKNQDLGEAVLLNQAQSNVFVTELYRRWVEAESVKDDLEKETLALKRKIQRTPDAEKKLTQLSQDLQAEKEKVKSLTTQKQSSQAAAASASEERDKIGVELRSFAESSKKQDEEHKEVLARMEKAISDARAAYERMLAERDAHKTGEADVKARMAEMKEHHKAEIEELKLEKADLSKKVEDLQATKTWLLTEGAQLLAKNVHKGPEMTMAVAAVNNAMSAIGVNSGLHNGYVYALKNKTPYAEVPLLNRNAEAELNTAIACFDSLTFPVVNDLPKLVNEPLSRIKDALFFAGGESSKE